MCKINRFIDSVVYLCSSAYEEEKIPLPQYQTHLACIYRIMKSHELRLQIVYNQLIIKHQKSQ